MPFPLCERRCEMIRVSKDLEKIPASLLQTPPKIGNDVRMELENIYHSKCCYCEENKIKGEVEHYRPRTKYAWLEYCWENLLFACHDCNNLKNNKFEIAGILATQAESVAECDAKEKPLLLHPEKDQPQQWIEFEPNGTIYPNSNLTDSFVASRVKYTIETCQLNRKNLKDKRKAIYDTLINDIEISLLIYGDSAKLNEEINLKFVQPLNDDPAIGFSAFRQFIVNHWLLDILTKYQSN